MASRLGSRLGEPADRVVVGDADHRQAGCGRARDEGGRRQRAVGRGGVEVEIDQAGAGRRLAARFASAGPFLVLAGRRRWRSTSERYSRISSSRCDALFVGELEEDLLALGVLELLAVALEEAVRAALALDADHQRLAIVDAVGQLLGAGREQAVGRPLEKQERRPRLELRILLQQLAVARLERAEVLLLLLGQLLEDAAAARVARDARGARVELEAAALGRDRDAQRVAREEQLGHAAFGDRRPAGPARFARAVNLQHALPRARSCAPPRPPRSATRCRS